MPPLPTRMTFMQPTCLSGTADEEDSRDEDFRQCRYEAEKHPRTDHVKEPRERLPQYQTATTMTS